MQSIIVLNLAIIGLFTLVYLNKIQPNLIKKKTSNHIKVINNTIDHIDRLNIKFSEEDIRKFLFLNIQLVIVFKIL